jgi:hypothetical protein
MEAEKEDRLESSSLRFVLLWHALPILRTGEKSSLRGSHFDFMFENGGHLVTFELPRIPIPSERLPLIRLNNHRIDYLELEGTLSPGPMGEDRGHVSRWAAGTYHCLKLKPGKRIIELSSDRFSAQIVLMPKLEFPSNEAWPDIKFWEMYVSRWAMKEKNV